MERSLSSLDVRHVVQELREALTGGKVRRIVQRDHAFLLEAFVPGRQEAWLYADTSKVFLASRAIAGGEPPMFCMVLRKHLMGEEILDVRQLGFDRVVTIRFPQHVLVFELVHPGNVILCDRQGDIIMPLSIQHWRTRNVQPKLVYQPPPLTPDPFQMEVAHFVHALGRADKPVGAFLATILGLGGPAAREVCFRAQVPDDLRAANVEPAQAKALHAALQALGTERSPTVYPDVVSPIKLQSRQGGTPVPSFSQALDAWFLREQAPPQEDRQARIRAAQEDARERFLGMRAQRRELGDLLYAHYQEVQEVLARIQQLRKEGLPWEGIKAQLPQVRIAEHEGAAVLRLEGREVALDLRATLEENAARYYEAGKDAAAKLRGLERAIERKPPVPKPPRIPRLRVKKEWYEKFRWFRSSDGVLVIGGRDAAQNERIHRSHLREGDTALHADIPGASLMAVQAEGKPVPERTLHEAAAFAAAHSRAWAQGLGTVDVYAVRGDQVSKTPPSGMSLAKGSFAISGSRRWFRNIALQLGLGARVEGQAVRLVAGPLPAVQSQAAWWVVLRPGDLPIPHLARQAKAQLLRKAPLPQRGMLEQVEPDELARLMPAGNGQLAP